MTRDGWTITEALDDYAAAGKPLDQDGFIDVVPAAHRLGTLKRTGETKSGRRGGRGQARYEIGTLQEMHKDLARWIPAQDPPPGDT